MMNLKTIVNGAALLSLLCALGGFFFFVAGSDGVATIGFTIATVLSIPATILFLPANEDEEEGVRNLFFLLLIVYTAVLLIVAYFIYSDPDIWSGGMG